MAIIWRLFGGYLAVIWRLFALSSVSTIAVTLSGLHTVQFEFKFE